MVSNRASRELVLAWLLTPIVLFAITAALTRTSLLWAPISYEADPDGRTGFMSAFQTAREIYAPARSAGARVFFLGNSRMALISNNAVEEALRRRPGQRETASANLAIFGIGPVGMEIVSRHAIPARPALGVIGLSPSDLFVPIPGEDHAIRVLERGWSGGPTSASALTARLDRSLRDGWRLYRFREFVKMALVDRVAPSGSGRLPPQGFATREELFEYMRPGRGRDVEQAYRAFAREPTLKRYIAYLKVGQADLLRAMRARVEAPIDREAFRLQKAALDHMLERFVAQGVPVRIVLMPENPLLRDPAAAQFRDPKREAIGLRAIRSVAARRGVAVTDGRRWIGVSGFLDLDHVFPQSAGAEQKLAELVLDAVPI